MRNAPIDFALTNESMINNSVLRKSGLRRLEKAQEQLRLNQNVVDINSKEREECFVDDCTSTLIDARKAGTCFDFQSCLDDCRRRFNPLIQSAQESIDRLLRQIARLNRVLGNR